MVFRQLESLTAADQGQLDQLRQRIRYYGRVCVAYSGGVDSALVAAIAQEQLAEAALAVTGISPALAPHLREEARLQAQWLGIAHQDHVSDKYRVTAVMCQGSPCGTNTNYRNTPLTLSTVALYY